MSKTHKISINLEITSSEMDKLKKDTDNIIGSKGLNRETYRIVCEGKDANGNEVSWNEKAYNSTLALAVGAVACQIKVGNPNCSATEI